MSERTSGDRSASFRSAVPQFIPFMSVWKTAVCLWIFLPKSVQSDENNRTISDVVGFRCLTYNRQKCKSDSQHCETIQSCQEPVGGIYGCYAVWNEINGHSEVSSYAVFCVQPYITIGCRWLSRDVGMWLTSVMILIVLLPKPPTLSSAVARPQCATLMCPTTQRLHHPSQQLLVKSHSWKQVQLFFTHFFSLIQVFSVPWTLLLCGSRFFIPWCLLV